MRKEKTLEMILDQERLVAEFLQKKQIKLTRKEELYLWFRGLDSLNYAYLSTVGGRKLFFVIPEVAALAEKFDQLEIDFVNKQKKDEMDLYPALQELQKAYQLTVDSLFAEVKETGIHYKIRFRMGTMLADELYKLLQVMIGAERNVVNLVIYEMIEYLCKRRYKIAYKAYEKLAKQLLKPDFLDTVAIRELLRSYLKVSGTFKPSYQIKMMRIFGVNLHKLIQDWETIKLFEALFR